jgi:D-aminoacyl-tRNA deacylase
MRAVVQRVSRASVHVDDELFSEIEAGLLVLLGVKDGDVADQANAMADKIANLRVFPDDDGKMNRSVLDVGGEVLIVSQFTLYGDAKRGRRPSFVEAARPEDAEPLVQRVAHELHALGLNVEQGVFGASMGVELVNEGPVTILLEF